ncbi:ribosomal RNA-processing protein 7 homolog A [Photinus pyralis]|uniref:RRM domain-containing protein n=1 Tax=Photinus pyralis TaxID=7054 RepID=A0A1Y1NKL1_PHOPY|nr:ribosomal RNA-processing protein 7 homolog A [Photinus pyralis]
MKSKVNEGFKVLPIRLSEKSTTCHELFIKKHAVRHHTDDKPPDRTLFVLNIPPYINANYLMKAFSSAGTVDDVILQTKQSQAGEDVETVGFQIAFIIFKESDGVKHALDLSTIDLIPTNDATIVTGIKKWTKEYNDQICDRDKLEEEVNNFVFKFDKIMENENKSAKGTESGGWTVVSNKSRRKGNARKESVKNKINERIAKQDERKYLADFYTFQKRESKMNHLVQMRKKYEEDKKRVAAMKQFRKFKPY